MAAFLLLWLSRVGRTEIIWTTKSKYLLCSGRLSTPTLNYYPVVLASLIKNVLCFPRNSLFLELCVWFLMETLMSDLSCKLSWGLWRMVSSVFFFFFRMEVLRGLVGTLWDFVGWYTKHKMHRPFYDIESGWVLPGILNENFISSWWFSLQNLFDWLPGVGEVTSVLEMKGQHLGVMAGLGRNGARCRHIHILHLKAASLILERWTDSTGAPGFASAKLLSFPSLRGEAWSSPLLTSSEW